MQPDGCNRFCATCSETIHDLAKLTSQEAEDLLRTPGNHCVRAEVKTDGGLVLKPSQPGRSQRMLVAVGASVSLLAAACQTAPTSSRPTGRIVGKVAPGSAWFITATAEDGRRYRATVQPTGRYRFKPLPYGSYSLKLSDDCGPWADERVDLQESEHVVGAPQPKPVPPTCIYIGMATIEEVRG